MDHSHRQAESAGGGVLVIVVLLLFLGNRPGGADRRRGDSALDAVRLHRDGGVRRHRPI